MRLAVILWSVWWLPAAGVYAQAQGAIYACTAASGQRLSSDRPIAQCLDREQRVLGPTGVERQRLAPVLSDAERAAQQAQRKQEAQQRQRNQEVRRQDAALLARYPDRASHDAERQRSLAQWQLQHTRALERMQTLRGTEQALSQELAFYGDEAKQAPPRVHAAWQEHAQALQEQIQQLRGLVAEREKLQSKWEAERLRLQPLWQMRAAVPVVDTRPQP